MPFIDVTLAQGRSPEQLRTLMSALTQAAAEAVSAPVESIRVVVREVPTTHWAAGDVTIAERRAAATGPAAAPPPDRRRPARWLLSPNAVPDTDSSAAVGPGGPAHQGVVGAIRQDRVGGNEGFGSVPDGVPRLRPARRDGLDDRSADQRGGRGLS